MKTYVREITSRNCTSLSDGNRAILTVQNSPLILFEQGQSIQSFISELHADVESLHCLHFLRLKTPSDRFGFGVSVSM